MGSGQRRCLEFRWAGGLTWWRAQRSGWSSATPSGMSSVSTRRTLVADLVYALAADRFAPRRLRERRHQLATDIRVGSERGPEEERWSSGRLVAGTDPSSLTTWERRGGWQPASTRERRSVRPGPRSS